MLKSPEKLRRRRFVLGVALSLGSLSLQQFPNAVDPESIEATNVSHKNLAESAQPPVATKKPKRSRAPETPKPTAQPEKPVQAQPPAQEQSSKSSGRALGEFESTCYNLRGTTASGQQAGYGKVAVDPNVIPLGTHLHIEGYGEAVAADTGSAVNGRIIDIWKPTRAECMQWGRRVVEVTLQT